jgi:hypothetical protein
MANSGAPGARRLPCAPGRRTRRGAGAARHPLELLQLAGPLNGPQTGDDGIEEMERNEGGALIAVQDAVAGAVAGAADLARLSRHGKEQLEALEPLEVRLFDRGLRLPRHAKSSMHRKSMPRK